MTEFGKGVVVDSGSSTIKSGSPGYPEPEREFSTGVERSAMTEFGTAVVVDNGSSTIKAGFSGYPEPLIEFSTVVGHPSSLVTSHGARLTGPCVGAEAEERRDVLSLNYPIERGVVTNWDDLELIWQHAYKELNASPEDHPAFFTTSAINSQPTQEKMSEIMFEKFNVPAFYAAIEAVLALYASGRVTGIAFDSGDGVSHAVPVKEGRVISDAIVRFPLAGRDLTDYLTKLFVQRGLPLADTPAGREIVADMKEKLCYVVMDFQEEVMAARRRHHDYRLPSGRVIPIGDEQFRCPEALFRPSLLGMDFPGIDHTIHSSISLCDENIRQVMYQNIVLTGGNTLFEGLAVRLLQSFKALSPTTRVFRVSSAPDRYYRAFLGASTLAVFDGFQKMWISDEEYKEYGPGIINKCISNCWYEV